jgi:hypothetical protein
MRTCVHLVRYVAGLLLLLEMFQTENRNTHFMFNNIRRTAVPITFIKCKRHGGIRQANDENVILLMPFVYWVTKTTNTYTEYVFPFCFSTKTWLHQSTSLLCYTYSEHLVTKFVSNVVIVFVN